MESRFDLIKQSAAKLKDEIEDKVQKKEMEKMSKRMTGDERAKAKEDIGRMFREPGYTDEKAADFIYKEHGIEIAVSGVTAMRKSMGLKQRGKKMGRPAAAAPESEEPKKRAYNKKSKVSRGGSGGSFEELMEAFENFSELLEAYKEKREEALASI